MAYDYIPLFAVCVECHRFCCLKNVADWFELPETGGLSKAVKQLSKKSLCLSCENKLMLEAIKNG